MRLGFAIGNGQKPTASCDRQFSSAPSEESCIRRAVNERGLNSDLVGPADASSEDEAATGTAFALIQIEKNG